MSDQSATSASWIYFAEGREIGPVPGWRLIELIAKGMLDEAALVKRAGTAEFKPLRELFPVERMISQTSETGGEPPAILPPRTVRCGRCAEAIPLDDHFEFEQVPFCDACLPFCFPELSGFEPVRSAVAATPFNPDIPACSLCGSPGNPEDLLVFESLHICPKCKPGYFQKLREGGDDRKAWLNYAPIGNRFAARFIDGLILQVVAAIAGALVNLALHQTTRVGLALTSLLLVVEISYFTICTHLWGQTLGKRLASVKVVTVEGERIGFLQALGRHLVSYVSLLLLGIGYLMACFDKENRTLHDRITFTRVVRHGNELRIW